MKKCFFPRLQLPTQPFSMMMVILTSFTVHFSQIAISSENPRELLGEKCTYTIGFDFRTSSRGEFVNKLRKKMKEMNWIEVEKYKDAEFETNGEYYKPRWTFWDTSGDGPFARFRPSRDTGAISYVIYKKGIRNVAVNPIIMTYLENLPRHLYFKLNKYDSSSAAIDDFLKEIPRCIQQR